MLTPMYSMIPEKSILTCFNHIDIFSVIRRHVTISIILTKIDETTLTITYSQ
jgi:hypothetical protein